MLVRPVLVSKMYDVPIKTVFPRLTYTRGTAICHTVIFQKCSKISLNYQNLIAFWNKTLWESYTRVQKSDQNDAESSQCIIGVA